MTTRTATTTTIYDSVGTKNYYQYMKSIYKINRWDKNENILKGLFTHVKNKSSVLFAATTATSIVYPTITK